MVGETESYRLMLMQKQDRKYPQERHGEWGSSRKRLHHPRPWSWTCCSWKSSHTEWMSRSSENAWFRACLGTKTSLVFIWDLQSSFVVLPFRRPILNLIESLCYWSSDFWDLNQYTIQSKNVLWFSRYFYYITLCSFRTDIVFSKIT